MTTTEAQNLKDENAMRDKIARAIADIRMTRMRALSSEYFNGNITASEFLSMTDNMLQDEYKQSLGLI